MRSLEDLAEALHPLAKNSVAALQLPNKPLRLHRSLAGLLEKLVLAVQHPAEFFVVALLLLAAQSFSRSSLLSCAMRCRWCERSASSSASLQGRL